MRFGLIASWVVLMTGWSVSMFGQVIPPVVSTDTLRMDSTQLAQMPQDSILELDALPVMQTTLNFPVSPDSLDEKVVYRAQDSMYFFVESQQVHLFGQAQVTYTTTQLNADFIIFDWGKNLVEAYGQLGTDGLVTGKPQFIDGTQEFTADTLRFNFKTRKGIVKGVATQFDDLFIRGKTTKFVSSGDSTDTDDVIYNKNAIFSTCNHPNPHFGIRSRKQKIIPDKLVVVGGSNLEIEGIPTPVYLPFGFYPMLDNKQSGLLFPEFELDGIFGLGLRGLGWYFPVSDQFDLEMRSQLFFNGSWEVAAKPRYKRRYKYNGGGTLRYTRFRNVDNETGFYTGSPTFSLDWRHNQDSKAHPSRSIGGFINLQTGNNRQQRDLSAASQLQRQINSNLSYTKRFLGTPASMSVAFTHSQDNVTRLMNINFPDVNFNSGTFFPLKRKNSPKEEAWFEKISLRYTMDSKTSVSLPDSLLFTDAVVDSLRFGVAHNVNTSYNGRLLKYFTYTVSSGIRSDWHFKTQERANFGEFVVNTDTTFATDGSILGIANDTSFVDSVRTNYNYEFAPVNILNPTSISLTTNLFATRVFKKGKIRGIRHIMKPSIGVGFSPDYTREELNFTNRYLRRPNDVEFTEYSRFAPSFLRPPPQTQQSFNIDYGVNNNLEAKVWNKQDSVERKVKLLSNVNFRGSYNVAADSFQWSNLRLSGVNLSLFKRLTTVQINGIFSFYEENDLDVRINETVWSERRLPFRFEELNVNTSTGGTLQTIRNLFVKDAEDEGNTNGNRPRNGPATSAATGVLEPLDYLNNIAIRYDFNFRFESVGNTDTLIVSTNTINVQGAIPISKNWGFTIENFGYDFKGKSLTYPGFSVSRDLHCWQLSFAWRPRFNAFTFNLAAKPGPFSFLEVPYRGNRFQGF